MKLKNILFLLLIFFTSLAKAQIRKYANEFLNIGVGSRGLAMGGAQVATTNDATSAFYNPAGLAQVKNNAQIMYMHNLYFNGIASFDYLGFAKPSKSHKGLVLGVNIVRFAIDGIANTLFLYEPDGKPNFSNITSFSTADYAAIITLAKTKQLANKAQLNYGVNTKIIHRNVGSFAKAWGFGFDAGIQYSKKKLTLAAAVKDISTTTTSWSFNFTEREKEQLYLTNNKIPVKSSELTLPRLIIGANYKIPVGKQSSLAAEINADLTFDGQRNVAISSSALSADPKIGLEYSLKNALRLRAGIFNFQKAYVSGDSTNKQTKWIYQPGAGIGVVLQNVYIDYAISNLANQDAPLLSHVFTLRLELNKVKKAKTK
jgi:hypothetical protein